MAKKGKEERFGYHQVVRETGSKLKVGSIPNVPDITTSELGEIAAWFLGPKGENSELLQTMVLQAVQKTVACRQNFQPDDPQVITREIQDSKSYQKAVGNMLSAYDDLLEFLQSYTTPYFSMRYQGHMLWDNTLPALCGYFATMLHNPNNVTIQASSATTPLELLVGLDLCGMVGYGTREESERQFDPWAHITCDGTVANLEALWSGRELKYFPFALRRMLEEAGSLSFYDDEGKLHQVAIDNSRFPVLVRLGDSKEISLTATDIDSWSLFNLSLDEIVAMPGRIAELYNIEDEYVVWSAAIPYTFNYVGSEAMRQYLQAMDPDVRMPVLIVPVTMHYSLPKSAALLGYGFGTMDLDGGRDQGGGMISVPVDAHGRMDMTELARILERCLTSRIPVTQIVGVVGTTEEGAVDNLAEIFRLRGALTKRGLNYFIHADAAWGGYMITAMRRVYRFADTTAETAADTAAEPVSQPESGHIPPHPGQPFVDKELSPFSDHVHEQLAHMRLCDSVTIDPHKMGYVQYPAGAILYRNGIVRRLITFTGAYIGGTGSIDPGPEPTVGIYGIEGSRAGAASAAVFMSHRVIRPDVTGHGKIIRQCMDNVRLFALYLLALSEQSELFRITLLCPDDSLPSLPKGLRPADILSWQSEDILALLGSGELRHFGPDLNILNYVCNPIKEDGTINLDLAVLNDFNRAVYEQCHVPVSTTAGKKLPVALDEFPKLFITKTQMHTREYGGQFLETLLARIFSTVYRGDMVGGEGLVCLRSVVMDPFMPFAEGGNFFKTIAGELESILNDLARKWRATQ